MLSPVICTLTVVSEARVEEVTSPAKPTVTVMVWAALRSATVCGVTEMEMPESSSASFIVRVEVLTITSWSGVPDTSKVSRSSVMASSAMVKPVNVPLVELEVAVEGMVTVSGELWAGE